MQAGRMDQRITIQQVTETPDTYGEPVESWSTFRTVWAEVLEKHGREYFRDAETVAVAPVIFRIRWLDGVTRKMRVSWDSETYNIQSTARIGRNEGLEIMGQAVVD